MTESGSKAFSFDRATATSEQQKGIDKLVGGFSGAQRFMIGAHERSPCVYVFGIPHPLNQDGIADIPEDLIYRVDFKLWSLLDIVAAEGGDATALLGKKEGSCSWQRQPEVKIRTYGEFNGTNSVLPN